MQLSHVAKTKILDQRLAQELQAAKAEDRLDLSGKKAVYLVFGDEPDAVESLLRKHDVPYSKDELSHLDEAFSTIYTPKSIEAGKLAGLIEEPLLETAEPKHRDCHIAR